MVLGFTDCVTIPAVSENDLKDRLMGTGEILIQTLQAAVGHTQAWDPCRGDQDKASACLLGALQGWLL